MFKIKLILIFLLFIFSSCSKNIVEKSTIKEKDIELQMIEAYKEGLKAFNQGDILFAAKKFNEAEILFPQSDYAP
jgi:outer membrane protein assembly factor BamD